MLFLPEGQQIKPKTVPFAPYLIQVGHLAQPSYGLQVMPWLPNKSQTTSEILQAKSFFLNKLQFMISISLLTEGQQTRSRAILSLPRPGGTPCAADLWATRPCNSGPCVSYSWQATPWFGDRRTVWCEASNGVKVTGESALFKNLFPFF